MAETDADARERDAVVAATVGAALLIAQQVAARAVRTALFLTAFEVRSLPFMMMGSALLAFVGAAALSRALARRSPTGIVPAAAAASAVLLAAEWALSLASPRSAAILVYLHVAGFGGALVSGFWSLVNERFDPFTARRVVGRIGAGATAGGVAGGALAWVASQLLPVPATLLLLASLHAVAALALGRIGGGDAPTRPETPGETRLVVATLARSAYLRDIALLVALGACVEAIVDFLFVAEASRRFAAGGPLLSILAVFHVAMSVLSLVLQVSLVRLALQRLGIAGTLALRPALTAAGAALGAFVPRLGTATLARGAHESLTNSLFRSAYELLYIPLPESEKRRVKALLDVAVDKSGALVGGGLVAVALAALPTGASSGLFVLAVLGSLAALVLSPRLQRGYVRTLKQGLLAGQVRLDPAEAIDGATQLTLAETGLIERDTLLQQIDALRGGAGGGTAAEPAPPRAPAPTQTPPARDGLDASAPGATRDATVDALLALRSGDLARLPEVLRRHPRPDSVLVAALLPYLSADEVFLDVLRVLRRAAPRVTGQLVDVLLDPEGDPVVRRRIPRVLKACATPRAADGLRIALADPRFEIRAAAATALAAIHERDGSRRVSREEVLQHVRRELDSGEPVDRQLPHLATLLSLMLDRQPLRVAWVAARSDDRSLRGTAFEYLSNVLPEDVFSRLVSLFGASSVRFAGPRRPIQEVAEELRQSSVGLKLDEPPWRSGRDG
jgi:AAA family ATP:ADP antiporter